MCKSRLLCCGIFLLLTGSLWAQTRSTLGGPRSTTGSPSTTGVSPSGKHHEPCWKEAGISQSVIQEHRSIERSTRAEIQSVCSDTSLTPQQRHEKAHQIREQAKQRQDAMLSTEQRSAFQNCRAQRGERGTPGLGGESLCGGVSSVQGSKPHRSTATNSTGADADED
jgi:hypothetical protein